MAKPKSDEGFIETGDGERDDVAFHDAILDNPEAEARLARIARKRAVDGGMDPKTASQMYGIPK